MDVGMEPLSPRSRVGQLPGLSSDLIQGLSADLCKAVREELRQSFAECLKENGAYVIPRGVSGAAGSETNGRSVSPRPGHPTISVTDTPRAGSKADGSGWMGRQMSKDVAGSAQTTPRQADISARDNRPMPMKMYQNKEMQWFMQQQEIMRQKAAGAPGGRRKSGSATGSNLEHVLEAEVSRDGTPDLSQKVHPAPVDVELPGYASEPEPPRQVSQMSQIPPHTGFDAVDGPGGDSSNDVNRPSIHKGIHGNHKPSKTSRFANPESALGFTGTGNGTRGGDAVHKDSIAAYAQAILTNPWFDFVSTSVIIGSAVHIGLQTDVMARDVSEEVPPAFRIADLIFFFAFFFEFTLRVFAFRTKVFSVWGWGWNVFDALLVGLQAIEEFLILVSTPSGIVDGQVLRVVRVLRTIRTIRVLHIMRFANDLQMLVSCLFRSSKAFVWSLGLIVLMLYIVGVYLTQMATNTRVDARALGGEVPELAMWYGNLPRAVLSLFQGLTGGVDWQDISEPPMKFISPWMGLFFFMYTAFAQLLVLNVVAATFVESSIERASKVRELQKLSQASRLFNCLDMDHSGEISLAELDSHLGSPEVQDFFESINVDVSEAKCLFDLIDTDGSGSIEFNEFLTGCLRLQGPAKSMDMVVGLHHLNRSIAQIAYQVGVMSVDVNMTGGIGHSHRNVHRHDSGVSAAARPGVGLA